VIALSLVVLIDRIAGAFGTARAGSGARDAQEEYFLADNGKILGRALKAVYA